MIETASEVRAGGEFRIAGKTLSGTVLKYGDEAVVALPHGRGMVRERFTSGAFSPVPAVDLVMQHDETLVIAKAGEYVLNDTQRELSIRAELRADSAALQLVRKGALSGYSFLFWPKSQRREGNVRIIDSAKLGHVGLVTSGAYPESKAELRARSGRTMRSRIPTDRASCECLGKDACGVEFPEDVLEAGLEEAFGRHARGEGDLIAVAGDYSRGLASVSRGTLRRNGATIDVDLPDSEGARALLATHEAAGTIVRPVIDKVNSEYTAVDGVARFSKLRIRAFTIGTTDATAGWAGPELIPTPGMSATRAAPEDTRSISRRKLAWL